MSENFVGNDVGTIHEKNEMVSKNSDGGQCDVSDKVFPLSLLQL